MALKFVLDNLDGLDDATKALYKEKEGKFYLDVAGLPQNEDVSGLKKKVDELLAEKKEATKRQQEAEEAQRLAEEEAAKKSGDVAALEKSWQAKLDKAVAAKDTEIQTLKTSLDTLLIDNVAGKLASELAIDGSSELLVPHIRNRLAVEVREGQHVTIVRGADGKPSASSIDDLKGEIAAVPAFAPVIKGSSGSGGGAAGGNKGGSGAGGAKTIKRADFALLDPVAQRDAVVTQKLKVVD